MTPRFSGWSLSFAEVRLEMRKFFCFPPEGGGLRPYAFGRAWYICPRAEENNDDRIPRVERAFASKIGLT